MLVIACYNQLILMYLVTIVIGILIDDIEL